MKIIQYTQNMVLKTGRVHAVFVMCSVPTMEEEEKGFRGKKSQQSGFVNECHGGGGRDGRCFSPSCFATLPLLLFALELPQTSRPNVSPLDHQAVLIGHQAYALRPRTAGSASGPDTWTRPGARSAFGAPHYQESLAHLDLGALAG